VSSIDQLDEHELDRLQAGVLAEAPLRSRIVDLEGALRSVLEGEALAKGTLYTTFRDQAGAGLV
jgi:hypothetical protein